MEKRRLFIALAIYVAHAVAFVPLMQRARFTSHTPYNHYALQAEAWLAGRLDLGGPPPAYTGDNDFAEHGGKHYVSFPPVPAALLLPFVAIAGGAAAVPDGLLFVLLAPLGPLLLFFVLERLRTSGRSERTELENIELAVLFGLGTVYWFTAVQGTVWFAGHVVAVVFMCAYLLSSVEARHPFLAGLFLGLAIGTRPTIAFAAPWFAYEFYKSRPKGRLLLRALRFVAPLALVLALLAWHNQARFGNPFEFGHRLLTVVWRTRIDEHGLFSYGYLGRNLAVVLTSLPFHSAEHGWQVNGHGLALWLTSPFLLWALWPERTNAIFWLAMLCALAIAMPNLLYQNTGWLQFGYRFSNDFAPFLFIAIAAGCRSTRAFWLLACVAVAVNLFGALTFGKPEYAGWYFIDPTQRILHQPL
jgi:hypothetical protein